MSENTNIGRANEADRNTANPTENRPDAEAAARGAAAAHGDKLITNPDGSHQVIEEFKIEQQQPERITELGAPRYEDRDGPQDHETPAE